MQAAPGSGSSKRKGKARDDFEGGSVTKKKRLAVSCRQCRSRKIACDRKQPCSSCIRRKLAESCDWSDEEDGQSFALSSDVRVLSRRLAHLEALWERDHPGSIGQPPPSGTPAAGPSRLPALPSSTTQSPDPTRRTPRSTNDNDDEDDDDDDDDQHHSDTEDAAAILEDAAFAARVPVLRAIANTPNYTHLHAPRPPVELNRCLTSILAEPLSYDQDGRPRSAVRLGIDLAISPMDLPAARNAAMSQIFRVLPGKEICDFLIRKYLDELDWDYQVLDTEAFLAEHERYHEMCAEGRQGFTDPLWIAVLCMVLALSLEGFWTRPHGLRNFDLFGGLSERELLDLPSVWHDAAIRALQLGEWGGTPRVRTIQCIVLFGQYIQISSSSGQQGRFLAWAASAIRIAQRMGLHRLGSDPESMPPDDPALPPGKNAVKRAMGLRLFSCLSFIDALLSDSDFRSYLLHPHHCNTSKPLNIDMSELSRTDWRLPQVKPADQLTDFSFERANHAIGSEIRHALDELALSSKPFSYDAVLEQDRRFAATLESLPRAFRTEATNEDTSDRLKYQRALIQELVHSRLVRLHRPFLSRGYGSKSPFRFSKDRCVSSACLIISINYELRKITMSSWRMYTSTLASALVCFLDLFHCIDHDGPEQEIQDKKMLLYKSRVVFASRPHSPALRAMVEQGDRILAALFREEESRRTHRAAHSMVSANGAPQLDSFAAVLNKVSREIAAEEAAAAAAGPTAAGGGPTAFAFMPSAEYAAPWAALDPSLARMPHNGPPSNPTTTATQQQQRAHQAGAGGRQAGPFAAAGEAGGDFAPFFETLASEDWTQFNGSDTSETLLGQLAATW